MLWCFVCACACACACCVCVFASDFFYNNQTQDQYTAVFTKNELDESILELLDNVTLEGWGISVGADRLRLLRAAKALVAARAEGK